MQKTQVISPPNANPVVPTPVPAKCLTCAHKFYFFPFLGELCTPARIESKVLFGSCRLTGRVDLVPSGWTPGGRGRASRPKLKVRDCRFPEALESESLVDRTGTSAGLRFDILCEGMRDPPTTGGGGRAAPSEIWVVGLIASEAVAHCAATVQQ